MSIEVDEVIVILSEGIVREVYTLKDGIQTSVPATVHDYDIEGIEPNDPEFGPILTDKHDNKYIEWGI